MELKAQKMEHSNPGIRCVVNTCHFYSQGDHCNANKIEIQNCDAKSSKETDCATYTPKNQSMS